jgi:uncharacterized protein (DUF362 family)
LFFLETTLDAQRPYKKVRSEMKLYAGRKFIPLNSVALVKHEFDMEKALNEAVRLIGGLGVLKRPFIIKPNLCTHVDASGIATTNVKTVEALIKVVLEEDRNLAIRIVESDSESKYVEDAFEKLGFKRLEEDFMDAGFDVSLINLSQEPMEEVNWSGLYFKRPVLPKVLTEDGYFVSLAVAKTHSLTFVTGVMKNLFGLLPRKDQSHYHPYINEVIVDLNRLIKPDLCIVDAVRGLEGVLSGRIRRLNLVIAGRHPLSVDATMTRAMGFTPERIRHLVMAEKYALGTLHPTVVGKSLESTTVQFNPPRHVNSNALIP